MQTVIGHKLVIQAQQPLLAELLVDIERPLKCPTPSLQNRWREQQFQLDTRKRRYNGKKIKVASVLPLVTIIMICFLYFFVDSIRSSWNYDWTGIRKEIKEAVLLIEEDPSLNVISDTINQRAWLLKTGSQEEFLKLNNFPNAAIRAIAYEGLFTQGYPEPYNLAVKVLHDHHEEFSLYWALGTKKRYYTVAEYIVNNVLNLQVGLYIGEPLVPHLLNYSFTDEELKTIDSLYVIATFRYE